MFKKYIITVVISAVALFTFIKFSIWDESERSAGFMQVLPYELSFEHDGNAKGFRDGSAWYVHLFRHEKDGTTKECSKQLTSLDSYTALKEVSSLNNESEYVYVPAWLFQTKSTDSTRCELHVGDWEMYKAMKQPSKNEVILFNEKEHKKHLEARPQ